VIAIIDEDNRANLRSS